MKIVKKIVVGVVGFLGIFVVPYMAYAASANDSTQINATVNAIISITSPASVSMSITPVAPPNSASSSISDTVEVTTNSSTGYNLSLKDSNTSLTMDSGANTIANHTGTFASPSSLALNSWGYRVDGAGTFGAGPTSASSSIPTLTGTWAGIKPSSGAGDTIKTTATTATDDPTVVWYAVRVDSTKPSGTYTNTVTYTATTN